MSHKEEEHEISLDLPSITRGVLLDQHVRIHRLQSACAGILAVIEGETNEIAVEASLSCLLYQVLVQTNWCGFYRRVEDRLLKVGPYQGQLGCLKISFDRGVCGTAARTERRVMVPNVHEFPGHIACDSKTNSELVLPVRNKQGRLIAVLDLDSESLDGFCDDEAELLEALLVKAFANVV